jgi:hypothetical protein
MTSELNDYSRSAVANLPVHRFSDVVSVEDNLQAVPLSSKLFQRDGNLSVSDACA